MRIGWEEGEILEEKELHKSVLQLCTGETLLGHL
jgi:hypothetical protein